MAREINVPMEEWFFAKDGEQEGPVTPHQIRALIAAGQIDPALTHVWKEGLTDWLPLEESGLLVAPVPQPIPTLARPQAVPAVTGMRASDEIRQSSLEIAYPGYGRLRYFLMNILFTIVVYAVIALLIFGVLASGKFDDGAGLLIVAAILGFLAIIAGGIYIGVQRVKNLGMSGWAILWTFVPFISIWIYWRMIACPTGYEDHRTLDVPAKIITGIFIAMFALAIVGAFLES